MQLNFAKPVTLFGGSFDPVHDGHIHLAVQAQKAFPGTQLVFLPAAQSPGKKPTLASDELRLKWLKMLAQKEGFHVWDLELQRGAPSYTVDTLIEAHRLGSSRDRLFLLLGADSYAALSSWREPGKIRTLCRIIVARRPGAEPPAIQSDDILLDIPNHPASSTAIRKALGANQTLAGMLPDAVKSDLEKLSLLRQNPYARKNE